MNGPQRTAVSRKELWQKRKQKDFLNEAVKGQWTPSLHLAARFRANRAATTSTAN